MLSLTRSKSFTLLVNTYDTVRQAVGFLRWKQGDAEAIAPSLWTGRGRRKSSPGDASPPAPVPGGPGGSPFLE